MNDIIIRTQPCSVRLASIRSYEVQYIELNKYIHLYIVVYQTTIINKHYSVFILHVNYRQINEGFNRYMQESDETIRQTEEDSDHELVTQKRKYEKLLHEERETIKVGL